MAYVGQFEIISGKMVISDPCCQLSKDTITINASNGIWYAYHTEDECRIASFEVRYEDCFISEESWMFLSEVGIDTAQLAFVDATHFRNDNDSDGVIPKYESISVSPLKRVDTNHILSDQPENGELWYVLCCNNTLATQVGIIPHGATSETGYGDGSYNIYAAYDKQHNIIAIRAIFLDDPNWESETD